MVPNPTADTNEIVAPIVPNARPLSNPPTITDPNPVSNSNPPTITDPNPESNPSTISKSAALVEALLEFGFTLNSGEDSRPVDEQTNGLLIDPLLQLAACFGTPTPDQNKDKFVLGKYVLRALHARGMLVQRGLEWLFDPALNAPPDGRDAGSTEDSAAGTAESTQAAMRKQI